jgi:hypothetical protein
MTVSRPALWCCRSCGRPLGRIVDGELEVFGPSVVKVGHVIVPCLCKAGRIWYYASDPFGGRATESARRP